MFRNSSQSIRLSWIKTRSAVFVHVPLNCYSLSFDFLIHYLPFNKFAVRQPFSTTRALNTAEYRLDEVYAVVYTFSVERVLLSSNDRLVGFSSPSLSFFLKLLVVLALIICSILSLSLSLSHVCQHECTAQHLNTYRTVCLLYHRFPWYATFQIKTPAETFPKFPSIILVIPYMEVLDWAWKFKIWRPVEVTCKHGGKLFVKFALASSVFTRSGIYCRTCC